jgi:hypothetical protein
MTVSAVKLQSAGVMHFAPDGTLFLADPLAATVYAIDVADTGNDGSVTPIRIDDVDGKIAAALGTTRDQIRIIDMVAHPKSQSLYFSLTRKQGADAVPLVVSIRKSDQQVSVLPLENIRNAHTGLADAPAAEEKTPWGQSKRTLTITDLDLMDGELYVAGLSNEEFASTLRRVAYPFNAAPQATTIEIWHTSHNRYETASPIETLLPLELNGEKAILAGYGCSPIVVLKRADLVSKKHARGNTVSELGGGNRPLDMVRYTSPNDGKQYVMIANSDRTLARFDVTAIASAPALTIAVNQAYQPAGLPYLPVSSFGVLQLDRLNAQNLVVLKRNAADGSLTVAAQGLGWL